MFVLLFAYVFGGAIDVPGGGNYREFLMGGIFAQTIVFTALRRGPALANDRKNQAVDRFRSLPIAKGAVLGGHAVANLLKSLLPIVLMSICGLLVGWRIRSGVVDAVAGYLLLIAVRLRHDLGRRAARQPGRHARGRHRASPSSCCSRSRSSPARSCRSPVRRRRHYETRCPVLQTVAEWNPVTTLAERRAHPVRQPHRRPGPGRPVVDRSTRLAYTLHLGDRHRRRLRPARRARLRPLDQEVAIARWPRMHRPPAG